jgi:hypothetical protein
MAALGGTCLHRHQQRLQGGGESFGDVAHDTIERRLIINVA